MKKLYDLVKYFEAWPTPMLGAMALLLFLFPMISTAATVSAASCEQSAVQAAVNAAADNDTVLVPAGVCTWGGQLNIVNKTIILKGAGAASGGTRINYAGSNHALIYINAESKRGRMEVTGFYFYGGDPNYWNGTAIQFWGPKGWKNLRIHHNVFDNNKPWTLKGSASTHGLIDNNIFKGSSAGINLYGEGAADWQAPLVLGTADFFFIEDNDFQMDNTYGATGWPAVDKNSGGRSVFRHNKLKNAFWETHDKARSGLVSANAYEIYNNTFDGGNTNKWKGIDVSAGTGVIFGNKFIGDYTVPIGAIDYKTSDPRNVRPCDGTDPADQNVPGESGWRCQYQIGSQGEGATAYGYPLYVWNNHENNVLTGMACTSGCNHVQSGRDFINNGTTAKPGYVPYQYPHPLQGGGGTEPPSPPLAELVAPVNLRLVSISSSQVQMAWDYSGSTHLGFKINRKPGTSGSFSQVAQVGASTRSHGDTVSASTSYCYVIRAYNSTQTSADSNELCVTSQAAPVNPPPPTTVASGTLFTDQVPESLNNSDGAGVHYELGMKFLSTVNGQIKAIRFYKSPSETGLHIGKIYSSKGQLLAQVSFTGETASGWQQQALATPLDIVANTVYVVSVNTGNTYYVATNEGFANQVTNGSLQSALGSAGVYGSVGSMPINSWMSSNYFRDIVFEASTSEREPDSEPEPQPEPQPTGDNIKPVTSVTSPWNNTYVYAGRRYTLKAKAEDNVKVTKVEFYVDGKRICTDTSANYTCRWTVPSGRGVIHTIQTRAYDAAGNVGESKVISVKTK